MKILEYSIFIIEYDYIQKSNLEMSGFDIKVDNFLHRDGQKGSKNNAHLKNYASEDSCILFVLIKGLFIG